jgi:hypothetical protein
MPSCPRCVQPVAFETTRCPHCDYDIPPVVAPTAANPFVDSPIEPTPEPRPPAVPLADEAPAPDPTSAVEPPLDLASEPTTFIAPVTDARRSRSAPSGPVNRRTIALAAVAIVALVVIVVGAVLLFGGGGSKHHQAAATSSPAASTTAPSGRSQAAVIASYLTQSGQMRKAITSAITSIEGCTDNAAAVAALQNAASTRTKIVDQLRTADVTALPGGAALVTDLSQAMTASAAADTHYAAWGQSVGGCTKPAPHNAEFTLAQQSDAQADTAKSTFVAAWNPVATSMGQPTQTAASI